MVLAGFLVLTVGLLFRVIQWLKFNLQVSLPHTPNFGVGVFSSYKSKLPPSKAYWKLWNSAVFFSSLEGGWIPCRIPSLRWGVYFLDRHSTRCFLPESGGTRGTKNIGDRWAEWTKLRIMMTSIWVVDFQWVFFMQYIYARNIFYLT